MTSHRALTALLISLAFTCAFLLGREAARRGAAAPADAYRLHASRAADAAARLTSSDSPRLEQPDGGGAPARGDGFVRVADRLRPSVVSIHAEGAGGQGSSGTGVIVAANGAVLTNFHVVQGMRRFEVTLSSYDVYPAQVVGVDSATDLAILQIRDVEGLVPATFGDSDGLAVGEEVVAVGNALDFGWTVTHGIISSLHRSEIDTSAGGRARARELRYTDYIQTDAAINPGNSGGPLCNLRGEVIGINVAILARPSEGIGFAIPSSDARFVAEELMRRGTVLRGFLGLQGRSYRQLTNEERAVYGKGAAGGALVTLVEPSSPAEKAGIRPSDFITGIDGRPVEDYETLRNRVARVAPGTPVSFTVIRDRAEILLRATVSERPADETPSKR